MQFSWHLTFVFRVFIDCNFRLKTFKTETKYVYKSLICSYVTLLFWGLYSFVFLSVHIYTFSMNIQTFILIDYRFLLHNFEGFFKEKKVLFQTYRTQMKMDTI